MHPRTASLVDGGLLDGVAWPAYLRDVHILAEAYVEPGPDAGVGPDDAATRWEPHFFSFQGPGDHGSPHVNDRFVTAALELNPLLDAATIEEMRSVLGPPREVPSWDLVELGEDADDVHLLLQGELKVVAVRGAGTKAERREEIARFHAGQWLGLPALLRAWDLGSARRGPWPGEEDLRLEVVAIEPARTRRIRMEDALRLVRARPCFRRFVEHVVSVRYVRRREMRALVAANACLRFLTSADVEYLLQLGAVRRTRRTGDRRPVRYLRQDEPPARVGLVLRGEAPAILGFRLVGVFRPGDLVGLETMVFPADVEMVRKEVEESLSVRKPPEDDPTKTTVCLAQDGAGTEVLEIAWRALRWVLTARRSVWKRIVRILVADVSSVGQPLPCIVAVYGARSGLGTTAISYGMAAVLSEREGARPRSKVVLVDLQGRSNFKKLWELKGFTQVQRRFTGSSGRGEWDDEDADEHAAAGDAGREVRYFELQPPEYLSRWPRRLRVVWPELIADAEELVVRLRTAVTFAKEEADFPYVVIAGQVAGDRATDEEKRFFDALNALADRVVLVTDQAGEAYPFANEEPRHLTWAYRMTPPYVRTERQRARQIPFDWTVGHWLTFAPTGVRRFLRDELDFDPLARLAEDERLRKRHVVRIPDDPEGAALFDAGQLDALVAVAGAPAGLRPGGSGPTEGALARAFGRLARVVEGRTVGLALGGGGAWGYAHVALIQTMEKTGVPIDYLAGTSMGSIVGGLYAGGGRAALDRLVAENSGRGPAILAAPASPLMRAILFAMVHGRFLQGFIDSFLRRVLPLGFEVPTLGTTEIPFLPISTDVSLAQDNVELRAGIGWGARASGSLPPMVSPMTRLGSSIVDGAISASVPARALKEMGADFVIASNVVPSMAGAAPGPDAQGALLDLLRTTVFGRLSSVGRGFYVMGWMQGQEQAQLYAEVRLCFPSPQVGVFEMWKAGSIIGQIRTAHFTGEDERKVREAWDRFGDARRRLHEALHSLPSLLLAVNELKPRAHHARARSGHG